MPFLDLSRRTAPLRPRLEGALGRMLEAGVVLWGPEVEAFESEWAAFTGRRHVVSVASGTDALRLSLIAVGVEAGGEVIVPALTAIPTAAAVCAAGAVPVPVDVNPLSGCLDPDAARAAVNARTQAAIVVHLYGRPAELPDLGVPIVEDAAHAHGAFDGSEPGGAAAAYSFYPTKNLGGIGDGGAVATDDDAIAERLRSLRVHGRNAAGEFVEASGNSRLSEIEAAALRLGLETLVRGNQRRGEIAAAYAAAAPSVVLQAPHPRHVHHLCVARVPERDRIREEAPFGTLVHYPRAVPDEPAYARFARDPVPHAQAWAAECVSLPCYPELRDDEVELVCEGLARWP